MYVEVANQPLVAVARFGYPLLPPACTHVSCEISQPRGRQCTIALNNHVTFSVNLTGNKWLAVGGNPSFESTFLWERVDGRSRAHRVRIRSPINRRARPMRHLSRVQSGSEDAANSNSAGDGNDGDENNDSTADENPDTQAPEEIEKDGARLGEWDVESEEVVSEDELSGLYSRISAMREREVEVRLACVCVCVCAGPRRRVVDGMGTELSGSRLYAVHDSMLLDQDARRRVVIGG